MMTSRVFPRIAPNLYAAPFLAKSSAEFPLGTNLLRTARDVTSRWQKYTARGLGPRGQLGRLFHFHDIALKNELRGQWKRADFFWRNAQRLVRALDKQRIWDRLDTTVAADDLRSAVIVEVLLETHLAMFQGCRKEDRKQFGARGSWHLTQVAQLTELARLDAAARTRLLGPLFKSFVIESVAAADWPTALDFARRAFTLSPDRESRELLGWVYFSQIGHLAEHGDPGKQTAVAIAEIVRLRGDAPAEVIYFNWLAQLHMLEVYRLAKADQVSQALLHCGRALAYEPDFPSAREAFDALIKRMQNLQAAVRDLIANLGYNQYLNAQGLRLKADADSGFIPVNTFMDSDEARQLRVDRSNAIALQIWRSIDLGEPHDPDLPRLLLEGLEDVWGRASENPASIPDLAAEIVSRRPPLQAVDRDKIEAYLRRRLGGAEAQTTAPTPAAPSSPTPPVSALPPKRAKWQIGEPFGYWLFAKEGWGLKLQALAAAILLAITAGLVLRENVNRSNRDRLYDQMNAAVLRQDHLATMEAAEGFLSHGIIASDAREAEVRQTFAEALTQWFNSAEPADELTERHLGKYRTLVLSAERNQP